MLNNRAQYADDMYSIWAQSGYELSTGLKAQPLNVIVWNTKHNVQNC